MWCPGRCLFWLVFASFVLSGCPEAPDHGAKILSVREGEFGNVVVFSSRDGKDYGGLSDPGIPAGSPRWSSDGDRILYVSRNDIMIMDEDGGNKTVILEDKATGGSGADSSDPYLVRFSPDERRAFFSAYAAEDGVQNYVIGGVDLDGTN